MASYTDNYALTKPTMAESADIRVINSNMDTVDDVLHSTQISLAPAYDLNETYNTGDVVMYELLMYECLEDDVTGAWDATKWQRTTAGEHGGGSDVEVTQIQTEGKAVASIAVDGVSTDILIPELKVYGEATGDLITIDDAMKAPLEECKVTLEPQQDLHGYDHPWVGGAGKNKINLADIVVPSAGFVYNREPANIAVNTYTLSLNFIGSSGSISISLRNGETIVSTLQDQPLVNGLNTFTMPTLSNNADSISLYSGVAGTYENFMLEIGTQATTYEPYSNICPISGWSAVDVNVSGANVWDEEWEVGLINHTTGNHTTGNGICSKNYISIKANTNYYAHISTWYRIAFYDDNNIYISGEQFSSNIFTTPTNAKYMKFSTNALYGTTYNHDISINYPSTDTSYHAYNGATYTIDLDGTRYGGTLDVVSGVLTVDRVEVDLGSLTWTTLASGRHSTFIADGKFAPTNTDIANALSSQYKVTSATNIPNIDSSFCYGANGVANLLVNDSRYNGEDASEFKTHMSGVQVVYKLATPQEIQLTPTEVTMLLGINNLWSDGEMYIKYRRDIEMLLQRIADSLGGNA